MARRAVVRPELMAASWSSPVLLDSCRPSGRGRCVKAREATACGLALTQRTRPRQSSSEEDARRLNSLLPEAGMPNVALPEKRKVGSSTLPLTTSCGPVSSALTRANAYSVLWCLQPPSDHDCPCVTMVGRSLSHTDRTPCLHASASRPLRPELSAPLSVWPWLPADDSVTPWSSSPSPGRFSGTWPRPVLSQAPPPNPIAAEPDGRRVLSGGGGADHAVTPKAPLTGSGCREHSYGGFGGGHSHFHPHAVFGSPANGFSRGSVIHRSPLLLTGLSA